MDDVIARQQALVAAADGVIAEREATGLDGLQDDFRFLACVHVLTGLLSRG